MIGNSQRTLLSAIAILLLLQVWADVWLDALTKNHYWHSERQQYEHVPDNAEHVDWDGSTSDQAYSDRVPWAEDPCPVVVFMHQGATQSEIAALRPFHSVWFTIFSYMVNDVHLSRPLLYAPKHSPPVS